MLVVRHYRFLSHLLPISLSNSTHTHHSLSGTVDIIGVVHKNGELGSITTKKGNELSKRDLMIVDQGGKTVRLTLWGETSQRPDSDFENFPIVAIKGVRVNEYNGRSLSVLQSSVFVLDPTVQEAEELRKWYDDEVVANNLSITPLQEITVMSGRKRTRKLLSCIKEEGLGYGEKADWVTVKGTVCIIKTKKRDGKLPMYPACPEEGKFVCVCVGVTL
jgi:replication factor A1